MVRVNGYESSIWVNKDWYKGRKITQMCIISTIKYANAHMQERLSSLSLSSFGVGFKNNVNHQASNMFQEEFSRLEGYKLFQEMLKLLDMFS